MKLMGRQNDCDLQGPLPGLDGRSRSGLRGSAQISCSAVGMLQKGKAVAAELQRGADAASIEVVQVDLASRKSIGSFAKKILETHHRLDVLINNPGVSRGGQPWEKNADGIELTFATNVIGYYLTSFLLLPRLREN